MSGVIILLWAITVAQILLVIGMMCCVARIIRGPHAQDRILAVDALYVTSMLMLLTFGIRVGNEIYFEAALVIAILGFVSTAALSKFLMRGEVIE